MASLEIHLGASLLAAVPCDASRPAQRSGTSPLLAASLSSPRLGDASASSCALIVALGAVRWRVARRCRRRCELYARSCAPKVRLSPQGKEVLHPNGTTLEEKFAAAKLAIAEAKALMQGGVAKVEPSSSSTLPAEARSDVDPSGAAAVTTVPPKERLPRGDTLELDQAVSPNLAVDTEPPGKMLEYGAFAREAPHSEALDQSTAGSYKGRAVVFWDLDNKIPSEGVSVNATIAAIRDLLREDGDAAEDIQLYANTVTLGLAYGAGMSSEGSIVGSPYEPAEEAVVTVCPVCQKPLKGNAFMRRKGLRQHLELHKQQENRRTMLKDSVGRSMRGGQRAQFGFESQRFFNGREQIFQLVGRIEGVSMKESVRARCRDFERFKGASLTPVPVKSQAADEELHFDIDALLISQRARVATGTLCLISDDGGFKKALHKAAMRGWRIVTVSVRDGMRERSDRSIEWKDLMARARTVAPSAPERAAGDIFFRFPYMRE